MTETVLIDIDPLLLERVRRVATAHGWGQQQALVHLLEHGLFACEAELAARFSDNDAQALQEAIAALEQQWVDVDQHCFGHGNVPPRLRRG